VQAVARTETDSTPVSELVLPVAGARAACTDKGRGTVKHFAGAGDGGAEDGMPPDVRCAHLLEHHDHVTRLGAHGRGLGARLDHEAPESRHDSMRLARRLWRRRCRTPDG